MAKASSISGTNKKALLERQASLKRKGAKTRLVRSGRVRWNKGTRQQYTLWWWY